jgi:DnaJ domain
MPPPAFAPSVPLAAAPASAFLGARLRTVSTAALPGQQPPSEARAQPPSARLNFFGTSPDRYGRWAEELFSSARLPFKPAAPGASSPRHVAAPSLKQPDFVTTSSTAHTLTVASCIPISAARDAFEITVDVTGTSLAISHTSPGQFIQLARPVKGVLRRGFFIIASPPISTGSPSSSTLQFIVSAFDDALRLSTLRRGDTLRASPVAGDGLEHSTLASAKRLHVFADCAQGYAAVRSLVEWDAFKAASGRGANRTTQTTIFYSIPTPQSLPYASMISKWATYGVNVVPVIRQSLTAFATAASRSGEGAKDDMALLCVADIMTAEALFVPLASMGLPRTSFHTFTQQRIEKEVSVFEDDDAWLGGFRKGNVFEAGNSCYDFGVGGERPVGMPDAVFEDFRRQQIEDEIWRRWVDIRDAARTEFERKWAQRGSSQSRTSRQARQEEAEKKQAWASWFATNRDAWPESMADDVKWGSYWSSWSSEHAKWGGSEASGFGNAAHAWGNAGSTWSQSNSQEYWDRGSAGSSSGSGDRYANANGSWGSKKTSGYQEPGYRYQHRDEAPGGNSQQSGRYTHGQNRSQSWNNGQQQQRSYNSSRSAGNSGNRFGGGGEVDLYAVLGLNSSATKVEIKKAYRKAALNAHPDLHPEKGRQATEEMQQIIVAYMTLKDASKRSTYDRFGI